MKKLTAILMSMMALAAKAQTEVDWRGNGRPEHMEEVSVDATGAHRAPHRVGSQQTAPLKAMGIKKVPVVLVAFADKAFSAADGTPTGVNSYYRLFCNGTMDGQLYTGHGSHGSVRDYFVEQSDSAFLPEFSVIGPVTLNMGYASYGANSGNSKDINFGAFRSEAITLAQEAYDGQWSDFDNDGNGSVDMIFFVYAGLGENSGGDADCIWPKEGTRATTINGTRYDSYGCTCEARPATRDENGNVTATMTDGVGVFIHELSHALGLPDFYDTKSVAFGMDQWSVMDYGQYGNNGYNPGNYTAYERDFMGWRPLQTLTEPCILTIRCFAEGGYGYKVVNEANPNEYYILENRQARGWDDKVCTLGHGLQVTHVDFINDRWKGNSVNTDPAHQLMTIIAANNDYRGSNAAQTSSQWRTCLGGNLYPGSECNYNLTDESTPASVVFTGGLMHQPIRNITENEDGTITLCFRTHGQLDVPVLDEPQDVDVHSFTATWAEVKNATSYTIQVEEESMGIVAELSQGGTTATFDDLRSSASLKYRVKAQADSPEDYLDSEWSEYVYLQTLVDEISNVDDREKEVSLYNMGGILVSTCYADELHRLDLRPGIYVMKYSNGEAKKVLMR